MTDESVPEVAATPVELAPGAALEIPGDIDTPALVVDLERMRANLDAMADHARSVGVDLYPHTKTRRTLEYAQMQLDSGAKGLTVAQLAEAEVFIDAGFTIGERVQVLPVHICAAFHVLGESVAMEGGHVVGRWISVARGSSQ